MPTRARCHHAIRHAFTEHMVWYYRRHPELLLTDDVAEKDKEMEEHLYVLQVLLDRVLSCIDDCYAANAKKDNHE